MKIHTLNNSDDARPPNLEGSNPEDSDEEPNQYYVGGSEHSGQQVLDPRDPDRGPSASSRGFGVDRARYSGQGNVITVTVDMYDNGFTVDNSALRTYDDPANAEFLDALKRREKPAEFLKKYGSRPIDVHCYRKTGDYKFVPFSGAGHRLGAVVPETGGATADIVGVEISNDTSATAVERMRSRGQDATKLKEGEPTVAIQFRFPGGQRIKGTFNPTMTIHNHLRVFAVTAEPALAYNAFSFFAGYPLAKVDDEERSIQEAGLSNSVVTIRVGL